METVTQKEVGTHTQAARLWFKKKKKKEIYVNGSAFICVFYVAAGACKNAVGILPGRPSVSRSALFAHGDHQDIRESGAQCGAPL